MPWRRFDLNGDGYIDSEDRQITSAYLDMELPTSSDIVSPTARITAPLDGETVLRGRRVTISSHAWDNAALSRIDYLVNGKVICTVTNAVPSLGFTSPFFVCGWEVPKRNRTHEIEIRVYDAAGNSGVSQTIVVQSL